MSVGRTENINDPLLAKIKEIIKKVQVEKTIIKKLDSMADQPVINQKLRVIHALLLRLEEKKVSFSRKLIELIIGLVYSNAAYYTKFSYLGLLMTANVKLTDLIALKVLELRDEVIQDRAYRERLECALRSLSSKQIPLTDEIINALFFNRVRQEAVAEVLESLYVNKIPLTKEVCQYVAENKGDEVYIGILLYLQKNGIGLHTDVINVCRRGPFTKARKTAEAIVALDQNNVTLTTTILSSLKYSNGSSKKIAYAYWYLHANGILLTDSMVKMVVDTRGREETVQAMVLLNTCEIVLDPDVLLFFTGIVLSCPLETAYALSILHNLGITFTGDNADITLDSRMRLVDLNALGNYMLMLDKAGVLTKENIRHIVKLYNDGANNTILAEINRIIKVSDTQTVEACKKLDFPLPPPLTNIVCSFFHYVAKPKVKEAKKVEKVEVSPIPTPLSSSNENNHKKHLCCVMS